MNNSEIMVSIFCTVYNHEKYLRRCLDGFVNQKTSFQFEAIVHDDASTDNSASIIREYANKYPNIIIPIYEPENQYSRGIHFVKERMYAIARGKYISYCEGDDYWIDPNKLQRQVDILEQHPEFSACTHNEIIVDIEGKRYPESRQELYRFSEDQIIDRSFVYNYCKVAHTASFVFRHSLFTNMSNECWDEYFDTKANGDMKMSAVFLVNGLVYHIAKDMACYRLVTSGTDSWSSRNHNKNLCLLTCLQLKNINIFLKKNYGTELDYSGYYKKRAFESVRIFLRRPSKENFDIMKKVGMISSYSIIDFITDLFLRARKRVKNLRRYVK